MNIIMDLRVTDWLFAMIERLTGYGLVWDANGEAASGSGRAHWERVR